MYSAVSGCFRTAWQGRLISQTHASLIAGFLWLTEALSACWWGPPGRFDTGPWRVASAIIKLAQDSKKNTKTLNRAKLWGWHTNSWRNLAFQTCGFVFGIWEEALWWSSSLCAPVACSFFFFFPNTGIAFPWLLQQKNWNGNHFLWVPYVQVGGTRKPTQRHFSHFWIHESGSSP